MENNNFIPDLHSRLIEFHRLINLINKSPWYKKIYYKYTRLNKLLKDLKFYIEFEDIYDLFQGLLSIQKMYDYTVDFNIDKTIRVDIYNHDIIDYVMMDAYNTNDILLISAGPVKNVQLMKEIDISIIRRLYSDDNGDCKEVSFNINRYNKNMNTDTKKEIDFYIREIIYEYMKIIIYKGDINE